MDIQQSFNQYRAIIVGGLIIILAYFPIAAVYHEKQINALNLSAQLVEENYKAFNILYSDVTKHYYGIAQSDGAFDIRKKNFYSTVSLQEMKHEIDLQNQIISIRQGKARAADVTRTIQLVQEGYQGFNILYSPLAQQYYALAQSEGAFDSKKHNFRQAISLKAIKHIITEIAHAQKKMQQKIQQKMKANGQGIILVQEGYKGFNILANVDAKKYYALAQGAGTFDSQKHNFYEADSLAQITQEVDQATHVGVKAKVHHLLHGVRVALHNLKNRVTTRVESKSS